MNCIKASECYVTMKIVWAMKKQTNKNNQTNQQPKPNRFSLSKTGQNCCFPALQEKNTKELQEG